MKILLDMNLSPVWVEIFKRHDIDAVHWQEVGKPDADDEVIMSWARDHKHIVFTHDLDFGALLRLTHAEGPSVIQVRTQEVTVSHLSSIVISALRKYKSFLENGALIIVDENNLRVRILPLSLGE